jgi:hypothetical protein
LPARFRSMRCLRKKSRSFVVSTQPYCS